MKFRPDIEGLRALAVALVVLSHLGISSFSGGYVGVDIFFVISGYLITGLIAHEYATRATQNNGFGWFSLRGFYLRRVKRIIPMSLLVLVATSIAGYFLFNSVRADRISNDAIWAGLFAANIHFINQATDYFQQGFSTSPLQHYWSLAVEEQFYLVFPALFLFAVKRHGITIFNIKLWWERRVGVLISTVIFSSFIWSIYQTSAHPLNAYFSSLTRAWELGIGALLAIATLRSKDRFSEDSKSIIGITGLVLIMASVFFFNSQTSFPGFAALIPVIGSALIIFSGIHSTNLVSDLLSIKIFTFLGRISYSIYLWHWPVIIFANSTHPDFLKHPLGKILAALLVLLLSTASYYFVEHPIRSIKIPKRWTEPARRIENDKEGRYNIKVSRFAIFSWVGLVITIAVVVLVLTEKPQGSSLSQSTNSSTSVTPNDQLSVVAIHNFPGVGSPNISTNSYKKSLSAWQQEVAAGNKLKELPAKLFPSLSELTNNWKPASLFTAQNPSGAKKTAYIFGDSTAQRIPYLLTWNLDPLIWSIKMRSFPGCDLGGVVKFGFKNIDCRKNLASFFAELKANKADLVLVTEQNKWFANDSTSTSSSNPRVKGLISNINFIGKHTKKLIFLGSIPTAKAGLIDCLKGKGALNSNCFSSANSFSYVTKMEATIAKNGGGVFADSTQWFCNAGTCPPIFKNTPVMIDTQHMSDAMSVMFSQIFGKWLWSQKWSGLLQSSILDNYSNTLHKWQVKISAAGKITKVPTDMDPPLSKLLSEQGKYWRICMTPKPNAVTCEFGNVAAKKTAVIFGDSLALVLYPTVLNSLDLNSWHIIGLNRGQCMVASITPWTNGKPDPECTSHREWAFNYIAKIHPDLLILSDNAGHGISQSGHLMVTGRDEYWSKQLDLSLSRLSTFASKFLYFGLPPQQKSLADCTDANLNLSSSCFGKPSANIVIRQVQKRLTEKYGGVFIDTESWMCASLVCPPIIDNSPVYFDGGHLTYTFAKKIVPLFSSLLRENGDSASNKPLFPSSQSVEISPS